MCDVFQVICVRAAGAAPKDTTPSCPGVRCMRQTYYSTDFICLFSLHALCLLSMADTDRLSPRTDLDCPHVFEYSAEYNLPLYLCLSERLTQNCRSYLHPRGFLTTSRALNYTARPTPAFFWFSLPLTLSTVLDLCFDRTSSPPPVTHQCCNLYDYYSGITSRCSVGETFSNAMQAKYQMSIESRRSSKAGECMWL